MFERFGSAFLADWGAQYLYIEMNLLEDEYFDE